MINNFLPYNNIWAIIPILDHQISEVKSFITNHKFYLNNGGKFLFKVNKKITSNPLHSEVDNNVYFLFLDDLGLYEAWNQAFAYLKQIPISNKSYVTFLGLDDLWSEEFVNQASDLIRKSNPVDFIYGNASYIFNSRERYSISPLVPLLFGQNNFAFDIPHPGMLNRWELICKYQFDAQLQLAADLDFYINISIKKKPTYKKIDCIQAQIGATGISNSINAKQIYLREWLKIEKKRKIILQKNLMRNTLIHSISRVPSLFKFFRNLFWRIKRVKIKSKNIV